MVKDIQVGQKFLSADNIGEVVSVTRKNRRCVVWIGDGSGDIRLFLKDGKVDCARDDQYDLRPLPVTITEGVEFSGEQYRDEFERLTKEGREFEYRADDEWFVSTPGISFVACVRYRLVPQHRDANGKPLKVGYPVIDNYGDRFGLDGQHQVHRRLNLQPSPVVITEGVEFSGEQYRAEFERLVKDGREFDRLGDNSWDHAGSADFSSDHQYRLRPQHRDAAGNPLKVGDRVEYVGRSDAITELTGSMVRLSEMGTTRPGACRKLTTKTRPLCADDLMQHRTALFRCKNDDVAYSVSAFSNDSMFYGTGAAFFEFLQADWEWSPCSDQPWQPCEVTEEVLA